MKETFGVQMFMVYRRKLFEKREMMVKTFVILLPIYVKLRLDDGLLAGGLLPRQKVREKWKKINELRPIVFIDRQ